jgi:hypothetical protein
MKNVEEKHSRLPENKNEEKGKSYVEIIKGYMKKEECKPLKENIPKVQKTQEEDHRRNKYQIRPFAFKQQRNFNHDHDQPRHEFRRTAPKRRSFTPTYEKLFYGHCFICTNFGHNAIDCRAHGRNDQTRNVYVAPYKIECLKCHNYGLIARNCRSMIEPSMKENFDVIYTKVWIRKEENINKE